MNADAAYWDKFADLNRCLNIKTMRGILENIEDILIIRTFQCCSQSESKCRAKIPQNLLIGFR